MVSSHAIHHGNEKTLTELLRIDPHERTSTTSGPVSIQLFGQDPEVMRSAAATVAERGADLIDLNMGCPVPKVCKTGAGAALLKDPDTAVAGRARRARGQRPAGHREAALRRAHRGDRRLRARPAARRRGRRQRDRASIRASRRSTTRACPTTSSPRGSSQSCPVPVILSGGLRDDEHVLARLRADRRRRGDARPRRARQPVAVQPRARAARAASRRRDEVLAELDWVIDRAVEHLGAERAGRYLRKFYPWYLERLSAPAAPIRRRSRPPRR